MPCGACVNFNRQCCVYDHWSTPSSRVREGGRMFNWTPGSSTTTTARHSPLCFTSKVQLTHVHAPHTDVSLPHLTLSNPGGKETWSTYSSPPVSPSEAMVRTTSAPPVSALGSPFAPWTSMSRTVSLPALDPSSWSPASTPPLLASPVSPCGELTALLNQPWFSADQAQQHACLPTYAEQEKDTLALLQSVDALLEQIGGGMPLTL